MKALHLALWQCAYASPDAGTAVALQRLDAAAAQARQGGADLLVCPEMSLTGYHVGARRLAALAETADGPLARAVGEIACRHGLVIIYGYAEQRPGHKPYNAVQCLGSDGRAMGHYRKTHLFGDLDRRQFSAGDTASRVFYCRGWCLGLLVCYDVEFPEPARLLALQGADVILVPTANMRGFDEVPLLLVPARACENRLLVAYANACGREQDLFYGGLSTVVLATGEVLARAGRETEMLHVTLDPAALALARQHSQLPQRRSNLYAPLAAPPGAGH